MYEIIKARLATSVPFVATVGISIVRLADGEASASLCLRDDVSNHIGTMHAGALFTLGETASGAAMSGAFAANILSIRPLATGASIAYRKIARGEITAHAAVSLPVEQLAATLAAEGKVAFDVGVVMQDANGAVVAEMTVGWLVAIRQS